MNLHRFTRLAALTATLIAGIGGALSLGACSSSPTRQSTGEVIDDGWITTKVKASFVEDRVVSALNIQVETFKGTVQLSGFANNTDERARAAELARSVKGVKEVKNDIRLKALAG